VHLNHGIIINEFEQSMGAHCKRTYDLSFMDGLAFTGDNTTLDKIDEAV
jgi:hypothetical protein